MMTFNDYKELAMRTSCHHETQDMRLLNACLGLSGEAGEVLRAGPLTNLQEELGDVLWYCAQAADALNYDFGNMSIDGFGVGLNTDIRESLIVYISSFNEAVKKMVFHKRGREESQLEILLATIISVVADCSIVPLSTLAEENIAKLRARYPEGFSTRGK